MCTSTYILFLFWFYFFCFNAIVGMRFVALGSVVYAIISVWSCAWIGSEIEQIKKKIQRTTNRYNKNIAKICLWSGVRSPCACVCMNVVKLPMLLLLLLLHKHYNWLKYAAQRSMLLFESYRFVAIRDCHPEAHSHTYARARIYLVVSAWLRKLRYYSFQAIAKFLSILCAKEKVHELRARLLSLFVADF